MNAQLRLFAFVRRLALLAVLLGAASPTLAAKTYSDNGDGTVTDPTTGLTWMRCPVGLTWDGATCTNAPVPVISGGISQGVVPMRQLTWAEANTLTGTLQYAGHSDWRLPTIRELLTYGAANVLNHFYLGSRLWSATTSAQDSSKAWFFTPVIIPTMGDFISNYENKETGLGALLVRAGQSGGDFDIARPDSDYVDHLNGTVTHTPTGLMWQKCALGQSWNGSTCVGVADRISLDSAKVLTNSFAGQSDWRLPTRDELLSLADFSKYSPSINTNVFPAVSALDFLSATYGVFYASSGAYSVFSFDLTACPAVFPSTCVSQPVFTPQAVRLVRAGHFVDTFALDVNKSGAGAVSNSLAGINCGSICTGSFTAGTKIILKAIPAENLSSWGGACASAGLAATCTVTMDAAKTVTATFNDVPLLTGLPPTLAFTTQIIGSTSAAQSATLTNIGTASLNISSITASGDFGVTHNCAAELVVGGFCTLNVTFVPTAIGQRSGTLTLTSDAPGSPHMVVIDGTGRGNNLHVLPGWNLLGNGQDQPISMATLLSDANGFGVTSVWKWDTAAMGWQFYAPSMDATTLQSYANSKGYGVLSTLNPGEGFWVNISWPTTLTLSGASAITGNDFAAGKTYALKPNWNLVAIGTTLTPSDFNKGLSTTPPATGTIPLNLTTLWAWDNPLSKWYFYAPNLEAAGGTALFDYIASKGYLDFATTGKTLGVGMGFWVNKP
jgi:hypothetical protein